MKMYIAVLDQVPDFIVPTLVAHAVLGYHINREHNKDSSRESMLYYSWLEESFKKCVVKVNQKEFDKISALPDAGSFHESKTLDGKKSCAVLVVDEIPNVLKFAKLWQPNNTKENISESSSQG